MDANTLMLHYGQLVCRMSVQVKQTTLELLKWIEKHWLGIHQEQGFDALEDGHCVVIISFLPPLGPL